MTTLNFSAIASLQPLQITAAHAEPIPACSVLTSRLPVTASNNVYSSASMLKSSLKGFQLPIFAPYDLSTRKTVGNPLSNSTFIVARGFSQREPVCF
jgi:hypothetical protein